MKVCDLQRLTGIALLLLVNAVPAVADPHDWTKVTWGASKVWLNRNVVQDLKADFSTRRTEDFSADQHIAVYRAPNQSQARVVIFYEALLPGFKYTVETPPERFVKRLKGLSGNNVDWGESGSVVSRNRRFTIRRFSTQRRGCFAFVRFWGQAQIEFTGEGDKRVRGYACGSSGGGMTDDRVREILDNVETSD